MPLFYYSVFFCSCNINAFYEPCEKNVVRQAKPSQSAEGGDLREVDVC